MFVPDGLKNPVNFTENVEHMQFTGLHDKNGKEIYEGDIIEFHSIDGNIPAIRLPVAWDEKSCGFHCSNTRNSRGVDMASGYDTISGEIIGDIYQNPELIN